MPRFSGAYITHRGRVRDHNEDAAVVEHIPSLSGLYHLWAVADGMGGMARGEVASATALQTLVREMRARIDDGPRESLGAAIGQANSDVFALGQGSMGTTLTVALVHDESGETWVAHVGDSRGYLLSPGKFEQITDDHSRVGEAQRSGRLTAEEAFTARGRNVLTRALGSDSEVKVEISGPRVLAPGETLLLCSDGVHGELRDSDIEQTLRAGTEGAGARIVRAALEAGGKDNITALVGAPLALSAALDVTRLTPLRNRNRKPALPVVVAGSVAVAAIIFSGLTFAIFLGGGNGSEVTTTGPTQAAEVQSVGGSPGGTGNPITFSATQVAGRIPTTPAQTAMPSPTTQPPAVPTTRLSATTTGTRTNTPMPTVSGLPLSTQTGTPSVVPTGTAISTATASASVTTTKTSTSSPTTTLTPTRTPTSSPTKTSTATRTPTATPTLKPTATPTRTPTATPPNPTSTPTKTSTAVPVRTATSTSTPTPRPTNTPLPTETPTPTSIPKEETPTDTSDTEQPG